MAVKDLILSMGAPPKLGARQSSPRAFMKGYKGSMMPDREQPEADEEDNAFDDDKDSQPDEMLVGAAQDVLAAQHARDPEAYAEALKAFVSMC